MLYILTSVWLLRTPNAGGNIQHYKYSPNTGQDKRYGNYLALQDTLYSFLLKFLINKFSTPKLPNDVIRKSICSWLSSQKEERKLHHQSSGLDCGNSGTDLLQIWKECGFTSLHVHSTLLCKLDHLTLFKMSPMYKTLHSIVEKRKKYRLE